MITATCKLISILLFTKVCVWGGGVIRGGEFITNFTVYIYIYTTFYSFLWHKQCVVFSSLFAIMLYFFLIT